MSWGDKFTKIASKTESGLGLTSRIMVYIASVALFGMMMLTVGDVFGRYFFNKPIEGSWELTGMLLICAGTWAMAYCQIQKGHIRISFILDRLPEKAQAILTSFAYLIGMVAFSVMSWRAVVLTQYYLTVKTGHSTETLNIPNFPFSIMLAVGAGMLALVLLFDLVHSIVEVKGK